MGTQRRHHPFRPVPVAHERGEEVCDIRAEYLMMIEQATITRQIRQHGPEERRALWRLQRDRESRGRQPVSEEPGLRGLAGSVEPGETDQGCSGGARTSVRHGTTLPAVNIA